MLPRTFAHPVLPDRASAFRALICSACLCIAVLGCERTPLQPDSFPASTSSELLKISSAPTSSLSALATIRSSGRGLAAVEILLDRGVVQRTPFVSVLRDSMVIPVLGLRPDKSYSMRAVSISASGAMSRSSMENFRTPPLPADMPKFKVLKSNNPTIAHVLLGITPAAGGKSYAVVVDTGGVPIWYKEFKDAVVDFQKQSDGSYTAWSSVDGSSSHFYSFDRLGNVNGEYSASNGLATDPHELRMRGSSYALFGIQFRTMDLTSLGGLATAAVQGFVVEYHSAGSPPLLWNTFDHFSVLDAAADISLKGQNVDPWHGNAIEIDADGNLLASFRNSDEITKINAHTGEIIWRLGGKKNQFVFRNDPLGGFSHQHGIRRLENGNIILFDDGNLHSPSASRAVEYRLDEVGKTAEMVWQYRPDPPVFGFALGFAQRLQNGNTLICFGTAQRIMEVSRDGTVRWDLTITDAQRYAYRAFATESLY